MMLLNTLLDELTGRGSGTEAERHERYNWLEQLRCTNPQADENGPMAGIPSYHWFRLPQALQVAGQESDLLAGLQELHQRLKPKSEAPSNWVCPACQRENFFAAPRCVGCNSLRP